MKYTLLILFSLICGQVYAQNLPEQNCPGAIPVCQAIYTQANSYTGFGTLQELSTGINNGCLGSNEKNDVWYIINVTTSGTLEFTITPNNLPDDYDFGVWDVTGVGCSAIYNYITNTANNLPPIGCNYSGTPGATGLSNTMVGTQWSPALNVTAGQTLVLNVSNFQTNAVFGYTLDFSTSTASIYDTVQPSFVSAGTLCATTSSIINVVMSEPIQCNSLASNGSDFYLTPAVPGVTNIVAAGSPTCSGVSLFTNTFSITASGTLPPGTYWLHPQQGSDNNAVLDNCGNEIALSDSIQFSIIAPNPPQLTILDTPSCIRSRVILNRAIDCSSVAFDGSDFFVTGPSTVNVAGAMPINCNGKGMSDTIDVLYDKSISVPGTYTLHVQVGSDGNSLLDTCSAAVVNTISWEVSDKGVTATADPYLLCATGYTTLSSFTTLAPSPSGYNYIWTPSEMLNDSTASTTLAFVNANTLYQVQLLDANFCYRRDTAGVTLSVRNPILEPVVDSTLCIGDVITFHSSGGINYYWYPATGLSCADCPDPVVTPTQTTTYAVVISDQYNCSDTLTQTLIINPLPVVDAGEDKTIYFGETVGLTTNVNNGSIYLWQPSVGLDYITIPNPKANPGKTTTYTITVIDTNECVNADSVVVFVRDDLPIILPSGFSPNGDGRNDIFQLSNIKFHRLQEFRIFNRWGQEVFNTTDPKQGWDGKYKGVEQEAGVYNYLIRVSYPLGRVEVYKGDVTLIR
jgi:gliding motility-associated-like protein